MIDYLMTTLAVFWLLSLAVYGYLWWNFDRKQNP